MRKFLIAIVLLLGVVFVLTRFSEIQDIASVLQHGNIIYLGLALLVELLWLLNLTGFYHALFLALGMQEDRLHLFRLCTAANFLSIVAPSSGLSGLAVFIGDARRRGKPTAKVTIAGILYVWFEYLGILILLIPGLVILMSRDVLHWTHLVAALLLVAGAAVLTALLYLGMQSEKKLGGVLAAIARFVNTSLEPVLHRDLLSEERAYTFAAEIADGLTGLHNQPGWFVRPTLHMLAGKTLLITILALCFLAFNITVDLGTVVAGISLAQLFVIMSPTPAGLGIVEGVLAVALNTLAVPLGTATIITLAYRAFTFWIPFFAGMLTIRAVDGKKLAAAAEEPSAQAGS